MQVIPVLDVLARRAVHATGGDRGRYRPVTSVLSRGADPLALACAFRDRLGLQACYLADLAAIQGGRPDTDLIGKLAAEGLEMWVDAAIGDAATARRVLAAGAARAVIGLETIPNLATAFSLPTALPSDRLVFSLDLREGRPLGRQATLSGKGPLQLAGEALGSGYQTLIVLELGRVGGLTGPATELVPPLRAQYPESSLVVGGGVRDGRDLQRLADMGCAGVLVATAVHLGRITRADIEAIARPTS